MEYTAPAETAPFRESPQPDTVWKPFHSRKGISFNCFWGGRRVTSSKPLGSKALAIRTCFVAFPNMEEYFRDFG